MKRLNSISQSISIFVQHDMKNINKEDLENSFNNIISYGRVKQIILEKDSKIFIHSSAQKKREINDNYKKTKTLLCIKKMIKLVIVT